MRQGTPGDELPLLHIYGTYPEGTTVSVVRYDGAPDCGAASSSLKAVPVKLKDEGGVYDATDDSLLGHAIFGVIVRTSDGRVWPFRVIASYPVAKMGAPPTGVRFDVTSQMVQKAAQDRSSGLLCMN